jgi:plastocyanin
MIRPAMNPARASLVSLRMERPRWNRLSRTAPLLVALVLVLAIAGAASGAVLVRGLRTDTGANVWRPRRVNIAVDQVVKWKAVEGSHTVTAYGGNWSKNVTLSQGETTTKRFGSAGTYKFRCTFHSTLTNGTCSGMCGKVLV